jgi:hypothetical protein
MKTSVKLRTIIDALVVSALLGSAFIVFGKYLRNAPSSVALFFLNFFAMLTIGFKFKWSSWRNERIKLKSSFKAKSLYVIAILAYATSFAYLLPTLNSSKAFMVLVFLSLQPLLAILAAKFFFKNGEGVKHMHFFFIGLLLIIGGIIYPKIDLANNSVQWGWTEVLILAYIISTIIAEITRTKLDRSYKIAMPNLMFLSFAGGVFIGLVWSIVTGDWKMIFNLEIKEYIGLLYLGLIPSAVAIPKLQKAGFPYVKTIEAGMKPILGYFSVALVLYAFGDQLKPLTEVDFISFLLVLAGVAVAILLGKPMLPKS